MNYKKSISVLIMIVLFGLICTACGDNREEMGDASGGSVSGSSVDESSDDDAGTEKLKIELEKSKSHFFANKTSYFMEMRNNKGNSIGFDQMLRTGGDRTEFRPERFITLLGVTDEGVYYAKQREGASDPYDALLCRIPFEKGKGRKTKLEPDKEELILEEENGFVQGQAAYIDSHYIVYSPNTECVIKYDRDTKKKTELLTETSTYSFVAAGEKNLIFADLSSNDEYLYRLDLGSDELEQVWEDEKNRMDDVMLSHSGYLFCVRGEGIWAYDIDNDKKERLASRKQILNACGQLTDVTDGQTSEEAYVENLFCYNRRLYAQVQMNWSVGKEKKMGYVMFRMDLSGEERVLEYDISLSVCMRSRSAEQTHAITPNIKWNSGRCHDMTEEGKVILILSGQVPGKQRLASYDLRSREFKVISQEDKEYFISYMDTKEAFGDKDFELNESFMKLMPDDMYAG